MLDILTLHAMTENGLGLVGQNEINQPLHALRILLT